MKQEHDITMDKQTHTCKTFHDNTTRTEVHTSPITASFIEEMRWPGVEYKC